MTGMDAERSRIRDGVRDSKIRLDISSKLNRWSDLLLPGSIQASTEQRHHRKLDVRHVERDFARLTVDEIGRRFRHCNSQDAKKGWNTVDFSSYFDEAESCFHVCNGFEALFHGFYNGYNESDSLIDRFKRNLPVFDGFWHIEDLLSWIDAIEDFFDEIKPPEHVKCKIVWYKMKGAAYYWWKMLQKDRLSDGKSLISSWPLMKRLLVERFMPTKDIEMEAIKTESCSEHGHSEEKGPANELYYTATTEKNVKLMVEEEKSTENYSENEDSYKSLVNEQTIKKEMKPTRCSTECPFELISRKHDGTTKLGISDASEVICEGDGQEMSEVKQPVKCVVEFPMLSSNETVKDEDYIEDALDTTVITHLRFQHACSNTSVQLGAVDLQPKQRTLLAGPGLLNLEFDKPLMEESQMESFINCNTPTIKNSIALLIKSTAPIGHEKVAEGCWMTLEAIPSSLINHRPLVKDFVGPCVAQRCKFVKVRVVHYIHNETQFWVLLHWLGAYSRMVVFLFDPGGIPYMAIMGNFGNYLFFSFGLLLHCSFLKIDMETEILSFRSSSIIKANFVCCGVFGATHIEMPIVETSENWCDQNHTSFMFCGNADHEFIIFEIINGWLGRMTITESLSPRSLKFSSDDGTTCAGYFANRRCGTFAIGHAKVVSHLLCCYLSSVLLIVEALSFIFDPGPKWKSGPIKGIRRGPIKWNFLKDAWTFYLNYYLELSCYCSVRLLHWASREHQLGETSRFKQLNLLWQNRTGTDGGHGGELGNVLIGVASCFGKIGINEVRQYKVSQTIVRIVEVCIFKLLIIVQNIMADLHAFVIIIEPLCDTIDFWDLTTAIAYFLCQIPLFDSTRKSRTIKYIQDFCQWNSVDCNLTKAAKEENGNRLKRQGESHNEGISRFTFDDQIVRMESFQSNGNDLLARVYATVGSSNKDDHNSNDSDSQGAVNIGIKRSKLKVVEYYKLTLSCYSIVETVTRQCYPLLEGSMRILLIGLTVVRNALCPHSTLTYKFRIHQVVKNWNMTVTVRLKLGLIIVFLADSSFIPMVDGKLLHGDKVGNIAGMGSDLFSSFAESSCAWPILTCRRAIPWKDWNDVNNLDAQLRRTLQLFFKLVNGLDPPIK